MKKIVSSFLLFTMAFNTIAAPVIMEQSSNSSYITVENIDSNILIDKKTIPSSDSSIIIDKKTFSNTNNVKIAPIDAEEKRKALVSQDPQNDKTHLDRFHEQRNTEVDRNIDPAQFGLGKAGTYASEAAEGYLNNFGGTSRVTLSGGDGFQTGSVDVLIPINKFYDTDKHLFFTQMGARKSNYLTTSYRTTLNLGVGYRYFTDDNWMYGVNSFYDHDITRGHQRVGFGAEAWTDNLKLSANTYRRISDWRDSPDLLNYEERPANGFDVRAEGSLPSLPQVAGKVMYEKYFGDEVGLFGENMRQKDPSAVTVGLNYKPVPLLSIGLDHRMGQGNKKETRVNVALNYQIGVPLSEQMKPINVASTNTLKANRTTLVERNNEIVLEYKLKPTGSIKLPDILNGNPLVTVTFPVVVTSNIPLTGFTWSGSAATFMTPYSGNGTGTITLPIYSTTTINTYTLQLNANDPTGRAIQSNVLNITVDPLALTLIVSKDVANANGTDSILFTATLKDKNDVVMANKPIAWDVRNANLISSDTTTDSNGEARATITSIVANIAEVDVTETESGNKITKEVEFISDINTASVVSLTQTDINIPADGSSVSDFTAIVRDANGNLVGAGVPVTWTTTSGDLNELVTQTDSSGQTTNYLRSSTTVGSATVLAKAVSADPGRTVTVNFIADVSTAQVVSVAGNLSTIPASPIGIVTFLATVRDDNGNLVGAGVPVNWSTTGGSLAAATSNTNASGVATMVLNSGTNAGDIIVSAIASYGQDRSALVEVTPNTGNARALNIMSESTSVLANNEIAEIKVNVQDAYGNLVGAGVTVNWTSTLGNIVATSTTNSSGEALAQFVAGTVTGTSIITARASGLDTGVQLNMPILADTNTANTFGLSASSNTIVAGSSTPINLTVTVRDANNNVVPNYQVEWSALSGTFTNSTSSTNLSGIATMQYFASQAAGLDTITAIAQNSSLPGQSINITVSPNNATARVINLTTNQNDLIANGTSEAILNATVEDANGNNVGAGVTVAWTTTGGTITASSLTNASGIATATLRSNTTSQTVSVNARGASGDVGVSQNINFIADVSTVRVDTLSASTLSVIAGETNPVILTANIRDGNGNRLANVTTNWESVGGVLTSPTSISDSTGTAQMQWTAPTGVATYPIRAYANNNIIRTINIAVTPNVSQAIVVSSNAAQTSLSANGTSSTVISSTVRDNYGNLVGAGVTVNWITTNGTFTGGVTSTTSTTNSSGVAQITLVSPTSVGVATVSSATQNGTPITSNITFTPDLATATVNNLSRDVNSVVVNNTGTPQGNLTATVEDANGNPISGATVTWSTTLGSLGSQTSLTNGAGIAVNTFNGGTVVGQTVITAKASLNDSGETTNINIIADLASARIVNLGSNLAQVPAGSTDKVQLTAFAIDAYGNSINTSFPVVWTTTGGVLDTTSNNATGIGTARNNLLPPLTTGNVTITARVSGGSDTGESILITFVANESTATVSELNANTTTVIANNSAEAILDASLVDANGNAFGVGFPVTWTTTGGTLNVVTSNTNSSGIAQARIRSNTTGPVTVTARGGSDSIGRTIVINFTGDVSTARVSTLTAEQSTLVADSANTNVMTATVRDVNGNLVGSGVTVNWTTTSGTLSSSTSLTNAGGIATNTVTGSTLAQTITVTAIVGATAPVITTYVVTPNIASARPSNIGVSSPVYATNTPVAVSTTVIDQFGNLVGAGVPVNWTTLSSTGSFVQSQTFTNASSVANASYIPGTVASSTTIEAVSNASISHAFTFSVLADPLTARVIALTPSILNTPANGTTQTLFTATIADANNNSYATSASVPVTWTTTAGTLSASSTNTVAGSTASVTLTAPSSATTGVLTARGASGTPQVSANLTYTTASETRFDVNNRMERFQCGSANQVIVRWDGVTLGTYNAVAGVTSYSIGAYTYSFGSQVGNTTAAGTCGGNAVAYFTLFNIIRTPN